MSGKSFYRLGIPSAILADGPIIVPLFAVNSMSLSESYHLPPVGSDTARTLVETHDDTIALSAVLIGPDRYVWKVFLETIAEQSMRGSALEQLTGGAAGGLILWSGMTLRTDIYVKALSFNASAARRDVLDVSITLEHLPRPGGLSKLLDVAGAAVSTLIDPFT